GAGLVNAGVGDLSIEARGDGQGQWTVSGSVESTGFVRGAVVDIVASFRPLGGGTYLPWAREAVTITGDGSATFSIPLDLPGQGEVQVSLAAGDHLPGDDVAAVVLRYDPVKVLLVGSTPRALFKALESYEEIQVYTAGTAPPPAEIATFDLMIVTDGGSATPATSTLRLGAVPNTVRVEQSVDIAGEPLVVEPLLLTADVDVTSLTVSRSHLLQLPKGAVPLFSSRGSTLAWARTTASGRQVAVGFSLDDSNWASQVSFPAFIAA